MDWTSKGRQVYKFIVALFLCLSLSACCKPGVQTKWCNAQVAVTECGSALLAGKLPGLLQQVGTILEGGSPDFHTQLDGLKVDGISVAYCVVKKYVELNSVPMTPTKSADGTVAKVSALTVPNIAKTLGVLRALDYLGTKAAK